MRREMVYGIMMLALLQLFCMISVQAKEKPVVGWTHTVFSINDNNPEHLLQKTDDTSESYQIASDAISNAISSKLENLQQEGKLPFQLQKNNMDMNASFTAATPIALVPIVVVDMAFDSDYRINDVRYYKSVVYSGVDLAFCCADEETGSWRILGMLPLRYYGVIGADASRTEPISREEKLQCFVRVTQDAIGQIKELKQDRSLWAELDNRSVTPETYQVTAVDISSAKAKELFGEENDSLKALIAGSFTSSYQQRTNHVLYPSRLTGGWVNDISRNLYSLQMQSPAGNLQVTMPKAAHEIRLDVTGIGKQELKLKDESAVQRDVAYKVWLAKSFTEGNEKAEVTKADIKQLSKVDTGESGSTTAMFSANC